MTRQTTRGLCARGALAAAMLCLCTGGVAAQPAPAAEASADLAKKLSNPISDLVSVPLQFNWEQGVGPQDQTRFVLNLQPVVPFPLSPDWTMIGRFIMPFVAQPPLAEGGAPAFGIGDITASAFFSPRPGRVIWGAGPVIVLPSTTQPTIGGEQWGLGPTAVVLRQQGHITFGALWNQIWSFAGNRDRPDLNQMFFQPFFAYNAKHAVTFTLQSESLANWDADEVWTVPINGSVSKVASFGSFPASYAIGVGGFATSPTAGGADWKLRFTLTVLLPHRG